jgi:hypothetical protein
MKKIIQIQLVVYGSYLSCYVPKIHESAMFVFFVSLDAISVFPSSSVYYIKD